MLPTFNARGDWVLSERFSVLSQTVRKGKAPKHAAAPIACQTAYRLHEAALRLPCCHEGMVRPCCRSVKRARCCPRAGQGQLAASSYCMLAQGMWWFPAPITRRG